MTAWLLPENRAALEAAWSKCRLAEYFDFENMADDGSGDEFDAELNMAALAWLKRHQDFGEVTLHLNAARSVTEQLIEYVKDNLESSHDHRA